ncbi:gpi anchored protein [Neofusicoccum parvum]|uniref:Gpi anchored protein n=1 Tax=Neofusicoccum parvum TaxID=310453 RepID=A0ACB5S623_9PEZI|nr:gpi anchored protein [Neofusicoccum parvum]
MPNSLLSLPSSLLLLLSSSYLATAEPWPYNLPKHEKYWPEHEEFVKRDAYIQQRMAGQSPAGVQKMSSDPGEKFYLGYWQFEAASAETGRDESADNFSGRAQAVNVDADEQYSNARREQHCHYDYNPPPLDFDDQHSDKFNIKR